MSCRVFALKLRKVNGQKTIILRYFLWLVIFINIKSIALVAKFWNHWNLINQATKPDKALAIVHHQPNEKWSSHVNTLCFIPFLSVSITSLCLQLESLLFGCYDAFEKYVNCIEEKLSKQVSRHLYFKSLEYKKPYQTWTRESMLFGKKWYKLYADGNC